VRRCITFLVDLPAQLACTVMPLPLRYTTEGQVCGACVLQQSLNAPFQTFSKDMHGKTTVMALCDPNVGDQTSHVVYAAYEFASFLV